MLTKLAYNAFTDVTVPHIMRELSLFDQQVARRREIFAEQSKPLSGKDLIKARLAHMAALDQFSLSYADEATDRNHFGADQATQLFIMLQPRIDWIIRQNTANVKAILAELPHQWPVQSEFGNDTDCQASDDAWLIVQHSDHDQALQKHVLQTFVDLRNGTNGKPEYSPSHLAYLHDRVQINSGLKQRYGTQGRRENGVWFPHQCESSDISEINALRASLNVNDNSSLEEYFVEINRALGQKDLPELKFLPVAPSIVAPAPLSFDTQPA